MRRSILTCHWLHQHSQRLISTTKVCIAGAKRMTGKHQQMISEFKQLCQDEQRYLNILASAQKHRFSSTFNVQKLKTGAERTPKPRSLFTEYPKYQSLKMASVCSPPQIPALILFLAVVGFRNDQRQHPTLGRKCPLDPGLSMIRTSKSNHELRPSYRMIR